MSLIDQIKADLASAHLLQQAGRFARLTGVTFAAQVAALGSDHLGRSAILGAAVGAVETAYRQAAPVVPWKQIAEHLGERLHLLPAAAPAPSTPPAP